jgi:hypothetical protein
MRVRLMSQTRRGRRVERSSLSTYSISHQHEMMWEWVDFLKRMDIESIKEKKLQLSDIRFPTLTMLKRARGVLAMIWLSIFCRLLISLRSLSLSLSLSLIISYLLIFSLWSYSSQFLSFQWFRVLHLIIFGLQNHVWNRDSEPERPIFWGEVVGSFMFRWPTLEHSTHSTYVGRRVRVALESIHATFYLDENVRTSVRTQIHALEGR